MNLKERKKKKILYKDFAVEWLNRRKNFVKESTYANYIQIMYNHIIPELGDKYLYEIDNQMLQDLIVKKYRNGRIDRGGGLSNKSVKDIISVLKATLKYAFKLNYIDYIDLEFYYPRNIVKNKINVFSKTEQKKILDYCMNSKNYKDLGIILTLYTGIRIGELCALKWDDINFKKNYIMINKTIQRVYMRDKRSTKIVITNPKTKNANRIIPVNYEFMRVLKERKKEGSYYVLSGTEKFVEPRTFRKYYYDVLNSMDIHNMTFHALRHTFATNCIRLGCDYKTVSELLGHASINITLNIYVHSQLSQKKQCINMIYKDLI